MSETAELSRLPPDSGVPSLGRAPLPAGRGRVPATVVALGVVSFFTDLSSEMIYPLLPVFLGAVLGTGPAVLGVIEGFAESTASLVKLVSGRLSDRSGRRKPWVFAGYALAGVARPLLGLATAWPAVLGLRFADRLGKGLRASPRDALIAAVTPPERRGEAFGVQRAFDHAGAVLGPLVAAGMLLLPGVTVRHVFFAAALPAVVVMAVVALAVREAPVLPGTSTPQSGAWGRLDRRFRWVLLAVVVFTLGNSTDAFLLLRLSQAGLSPEMVALSWSLLHLVKVVSTYAGGRLSDLFGRRPMVVAGWGWFALVYLAFALLHDPHLLFAAFLAYALYFGLTEPVEKAWVAELAPADLRGTAFGAYHGAVGLAALPASVLFGVMWQWLGPAVAFSTGAALAAVAVLLLLRLPPARNMEGGKPVA